MACDTSKSEIWTASHARMLSQLVFVALLQQCEKFCLVPVCSEQKLSNSRRIQVNNVKNVQMSRQIVKCEIHLALWK